MMNVGKMLKYAVLSMISVVIFTSCASLTGYQDGRSLGEGNVEISPSLNVSQSPDFILVDDSIFSEIPKFKFPNIELATRFGITEKLDLTARVNTNLNLGIGAKYQLVGDRTSKFALGIGTELGTFGLFSGLWNIQLPVYGSFHPNETVTLYFNPRFIHQFFSFGVAEFNGLNYIGGNFGVLIGKRHKFGLDIGIYNASSSGAGSIGLTSVGVGGKFFIGDNLAGSTTSSQPRKNRKTLK